MTLSKKQIRFLKAESHHLKPVVFIGKNGLSDGTVQSVHQALSDHELIKVKFLDYKDQKKNVLMKLTQRTESELVQLIGHTATLFRQNTDPEKQKTILPSSE